MAVITLLPRLPGCNSEWTPVGSGTRQALVQTNDGDTTYYRADIQNLKENFLLDALPADASSVSQVDIHFVGKWNNLTSPAPTVAPFVALAGCATSAEYTSRTMIESYQLYSELNIARPGGGAWTVADVNGASFGVLYTSLTGEGEARVTQIYAVVTYAISPPTAPSGLTASPISTTQIDLAWVDNSSTETGFKVFRCSGASCTPSSLITTTAANVVTYSDTGLAASTLYRYFVTATNSGGDSAASNTAEATTSTGEKILLFL